MSTHVSAIGDVIKLPYNFQLNFTNGTKMVFRNIDPIQLDLFRTNLFNIII